MKFWVKNTYSSNYIKTIIKSLQVGLDNSIVWYIVVYYYCQLLFFCTYGDKLELFLANETR